MPGLKGWLRLPRRTVRLRLTLLYGALFLASGVGLLVLTNVLVRQTTDNRMLAFGPRTAEETLIAWDAAEDGTPRFVFEVDGVHQGDQEALELFAAQAEEYRNAVVAQRAADQRQFLIYSGVALGVMAFVSVGLGWLVAGRVLRPLRTITATARDISATNLHKRLALAGPDDELKELGDTFDDLLGRLERTFAAQRQFVANASHELRTPLARQRTLIEVALADPDASVDSLRATHERVLTSGEQQERLIEALLTLARSERSVERPEHRNLAGIVGEVLTGLKPELERRQIEVRSDLRRAAIRCDPVMIERLVTNLLDNAMRYNHSRGTVEVVTGEQEGQAFIRVSNTGPRVMPEDLEGLFQPFRRPGANRVSQAADGYGLGLSLVQAIASAHGAALQAAARAAGGLDIEIRFPSVRAAGDDEPSPRAKDSPPPLIRSSSRQRSQAN